MGSFKLEIRRMISAPVTPGVCMALALGAFIFTAPAMAQQKAPAQPQQPAAQAKKPAKAKEEINSAWVKLCDDIKIKGVEGDVCLTHHERFNPNTGQPLISAAIRKIKGKDKEMLMVMVPLGRLLQPGLLFRIDDQKALRLGYSFCTAVGCVAEMVATPELVTKLKKGKQLEIGTISLNKKRIGFRVPLTGFTIAYDGPPIDRKIYAKARKEMFMVIRNRQIALAKKAAEVAKQKKAAPAPASAPAPKKTP